MTTDEIERPSEGNDIERVHVHCIVCGALSERTRKDWDQGRADPDRWRCEDCVRTGRQLRWPLTGVDSSAFASTPYVQRLHEMASAFLESARVLCESLGGSQTITWPRASVVYSTSNHAVELFLKACIVQTSPSDDVGHHNIDRLQRRFVELHPTIAPLDTVWEWRVGGIPTDQLFRYGADKTGATLRNEELVFAPAKWIQWIDGVEIDFHRIWGAISRTGSQ